MNLSELNQSSYSFLDWNLVKEYVLSYSALKNSSEELIFHTILNKKEEHYKTLEHLLNVHKKEEIESIQERLYSLSFLDTHHKIEFLDKFVILSLDELKDTYDLLIAFFKIYPKLESNFKVNFDTSSLHKNLQHDFLQEFKLMLTDDHQVNILLHPKVKKLANDLKETEIKIRTTLNYITENDSFSSSLRHKEHDIIHERFVLQIRSDQYQTSFGQIISRSESGMSLYIEPKSIEILNRERIYTLNEINSISFKIEKDLSNVLSKEVSKIREIIFYIKNLDKYLTMILFYHSGDFSLPKITKERDLKLKGFYHPLIKSPIKNNFTLKDSESGLLISGPNTGGKTATLKAISIIVLLSFYGLPIPADTSEIGTFKKVLAIGNDSQNLKEGLSSFSSEVEKYKTLLKSDLSDTLIIIDEIFNSTSSDEASGLAFGIIEELTKENRNKILISTHHDLLKTTYHLNKKLISAHMGFNVEENTPTFILNTGKPGSSYAFNIFKNLVSHEKIKEVVLNKAKEVYTGEKYSYEILLSELSQEKELLQEKMKNLEIREKEFIKNEKSKKALLQIKLNKEYADFKDKINESFNEILEIMIQARSSSQLKEKDLFKKKQEILKINAPKKLIKENEIEVEHETPYEIKIGHTYQSKKLNKEVLILSINQKNNQVVAKYGKIKINLPISDLLGAGLVKNKNEKKVFIEIQKSQRTSIEIDCRGLRLDEFKEKIEKSTTDLLNGDIPFLSIIHGHGDGVLKKWLKDFLKNNKYFKEDNGESQNMGETKIVLSS